MEITRELLGKIPDEVLVALHRHASGDLVEVFEEEILARMEKPKGPAARRVTPESPEVKVLFDKLDSKKKKRRLSAAGRKAISEASKRRWARVRKERAAAKKTAARPMKKAGTKPTNTKK